MNHAKSFFATLLVAFFAGQAHAQAPKSAVTVDTVTVTDTGLGTWKVVVNGTLTLGAKDTFVGFKFSMSDPKNNTVAPIVTQYSQPQPGFTTGYSYYTVTAVQGNWMAMAAMQFKTGDTKGIAGTGKAFTVP
jgi:hypothetical protein